MYKKNPTKIKTTAGLKEVPGITGSADEAAEKFAKGQLKGNFEAKCDYHGEHHSH